MRQSGGIMEGMAIDSPLRRWRRAHGITQKRLAQQMGVNLNTVARWEQAYREPHGDQLMRLMQITGLSADALLFPQRYLEEHPDFLSTWAEQPPRRGRPPRQPPEEDRE